MKRRSFLLGLISMAAGGGLSLRASDTQATPLTSHGGAPVEGATELTLPDGTPIDWAQQRNWHGSPHYRHWHRPPRRRRHQRHVCRVYRDRFGRRVRRCRWVWV